MSSHIRAPALGRHPSPLPLATFMFYGGAAGGDKSHMERCDAARVLPVPPRSSPAQQGAFTEVSPGPAASKRKGRPTQCLETNSRGWYFAWPTASKPWRHAVNQESAQYFAAMRTFTGGLLPVAVRPVPRLPFCLRCDPCNC
jgi:hypothetical protein